MRQLRSLFISAGEASADQLGSAIVAAMPKRVRCFGLGGGTMQGKGFQHLPNLCNTSSNPSDHPLAVIGLGEGVMAWRRLNRLADSIIAEVLASKPDAVLTIDSKGFSLRLAKKLRQAMARANWHAPIIHLAVPTVWAWGAWRANRFAKTFDRLLCLFPFEPPYFTRHGVPADYVGHPLFARRQLSQPHARHALGLGKTDLVLLLLPGRRQREVTALLPAMLTAGDQLCARHANLSVILPAADSVTETIRQTVKQHRHGNKMHIITSEADTDHTWLALAAADAAIMCSGTVTLESAMNGVPGVAVYRPDLLSFVIGNLIGMQRNNVILANVVAGKPCYALKLRREVTADSLTQAIAPLLASPPSKRKQARMAMQRTLSRAIGEHSTDFGAACVVAINNALI